MGKRSFPRLAEGLITHGLPPETPALLAEAVGHPHARLSRRPLARLAEEIAETGGEHPALILVGPLAEG
jgi:uroporphyrin-III C-methyltransferase